MTSAVMTTWKLARSETPAPASRRATMSRPSRSVPSQWSPTGPLRTCAKSVSVGPYGHQYLYVSVATTSSKRYTSATSRGLLAEEPAERTSRRRREVAAHDLDRAADCRRLGVEARALTGPGLVDRFGIELVVVHDTRTRGLK